MIHNFSWALPGRLAGFGLLGAPSPQALSALRDEGVGALVSLTEQPVAGALVSTLGMRYLHLPIPDMTPPAHAQMEAFVDFVDACHLEGLGVAVHCRAGLGRTGTMLAAFLIHQGTACQQAINQVRRLRPGSVETAAQEQALCAFEGLRRAQAPNGA